jgi:CRISPR system Cascade subunit CasE
MTTLTRLQLNPRHPDVRRDLSDIHRLHQRVMSLLPEDLGASPRAEAVTLWRLEPADNPVLLVQTERNLDVESLPAGYASAQTKDLGPVLAAVRPELRFRYRITVNPVRQNGKSGRRSVVPRSLLGDWWTERSRRIGIQDLEPAVVTNEPTRHGTTPRGNRLTVAVARIDGIASTTDPDALRTALCTGVGRARAYGCGLLTIAPL